MAIWAELEKQNQIQADVARLPQLLPEAQGLLRQAMNGGMSEQAHQAAVSDFFGERYHATGAWLLNVIAEDQENAVSFVQCVTQQVSDRLQPMRRKTESAVSIRSRPCEELER